MIDRIILCTIYGKIRSIDKLNKGISNRSVKLSLLGIWRSIGLICKVNKRSIVLFSVLILGNMRSINNIMKGITDRSVQSFTFGNFALNPFDLQRK